MRRLFEKTDDLRSEEIYLEQGARLRPNKKRRFPAEYELFIRRTSDGARVGHCAFRVGHTEYSFFGGNIGYEIYEPFRGNHYAAKACLLLYDLARRHKMSYVLITCNPDNLASKRTCELAGGILIATVDLPENNDLYLRGERQKLVFKIELSCKSFADYMNNR